MFQNGQGEGAPKQGPITSSPVDDRMKRGQIHQEVRRIFKSKIDTSTNDSGAIIATLITSFARGKKRGRGGRGRNRADDKPMGEYLHFTLFKDNRDTMDAVNQIARMLKIKPQVIGYAGTKDRRASTAQRCSVRYTRDRSMAGINGKLWGIATGDYEYQEQGIHLGELSGNEFTITIKNCRLVGEADDLPLADRLDVLRTGVQAALDHMAGHGWINYFGHQRFGTHQIGTHEIGKLILGEKYEEAVNAILAYDANIAQKADDGEIADDPAKRDEYARHQACMLFRTEKDAERAIQLMPRRFSAEVCVLRQLNRQGKQSRKDFVGAIIHITRGLRSMYLHAAQSHVWNHAASKRWQLHGEKVIKGDLVLIETEATPLVGGQDQDGDDIINPVEDDDEVAVRARPLTEEEASSGRYTVYDVVLPTPGYDVVYPDNEIGDFYREFMAREENGSLDPHKMRRMRREFSLPGRYRKLMNKFLASPSIEFKAYANDDEQMHPTDWDLIKAARAAVSKKSRGDGEPDNKKARTTTDDAETTVPSTETAPVAVGDEDIEMKEEADAPVNDGDNTSQDKVDGAVADQAAEPSKIAAVVKFQLGRSAYATVTLRELMGDPPEGTMTSD